MTTRMDVFDLRDTVVDEYRQFATSFTTIRAADIRQQIDAIYAQDRYWPEPLIQLNPNYQRTTDVATLVRDGLLAPECETIFRIDGAPLALFKHQEESISIASQGASYVVTTGTGSGKSLCFFIPIVSAVLSAKRRDPTKRTRAIIIYPMNALANSQLEELNKFLGDASPVTVARYTGQDEEEARQLVAGSPPDILLTNFMMLELLMTRQDKIDRDVMSNCAGLQFLVLDELHTYRGRQGADVAMLVRRVRERLAPGGLQCIGTSATMASNGTLKEKSRIIADVASRLFATEIPESNVIVERLERTTDPKLTAEKVQAQLGAAIDRGVAKDITDDELRTNPLAVWVETRLGVVFSKNDNQWIRAQPLTLTEAVALLAKESGRSEAKCRSVLRDLLLVSSIPECDRTVGRATATRSFFAFKLHQFISGAGHAFSTLEPAGNRTLTVEAQQYLPGSPEKRLYAIHFCRECGQEYHPVRVVVEDGRQRVLARDIDDAPASPPTNDENAAGAEDAEPAEAFGFLTLNTPDLEFQNKDDDYPETWCEFDGAGNVRSLKSNFRRARAVPFDVRPDGSVGGGTHCWFLPGKFRFCVYCKEALPGVGKDRSRLASLSAEGRSSATTVLVSGALRWMHGVASQLEPNKRKILGFTDNRQDAALQAGHFNDFLFVSSLRAGFLGALDAAGSAGIDSATIGIAQQRALGFESADASLRAEWLLEPNLRGQAIHEAEATLRDVLAYRVWHDQRRGWRYTNPNLEQLRLVDVAYGGIDALAADEELFAAAPPLLRTASPEVRANVYRVLFDHLRKWMAIRSRVLEAASLEQLKTRSHSYLRAPWGFGTDERPRNARWLMIEAPKRARNRLRDEDLLVRGGTRSALARELRSSEHWNGSTAARDLKTKDYEELLRSLLHAAKQHGLVSEDVTPFDGQTGWRLNDGCIRFRRHMPTPTENAKDRFFRDFYSNLANLLRSPGHPLFGLEAREHTAQVDQERRAIREKRFRFGKKEVEELATDSQKLRDLGESARFLPVLFCSPTMELGVDISALNAVYLRNVPPTPANYAQRSGRAGRSGQAALVITYCSAQGPHDQYFFREPKAMVHGEVRPPLLDLANRDLIESHLHSVWLAATEQPLDGSISEILQLEDPQRPLRPTLREAMANVDRQAEARLRMQRILQMLSHDLNDQTAPWFPGSEAFAKQAADNALSRLDAAFRRWRDLFSAAEAQRDSARRIMDQYGAPARERDAAKSRHNQAIDQIKLLQTGSSTASSDFYTYRYLATEGFLPGYNFPRLPLMAYIPGAADGRGKQTYLQRPRFLAISEFGPRSLVYHEGRAYRVVRALLSIAHRDPTNPNAQLPTVAARICSLCGAAHLEDHSSLCHACGGALDGADVIRNIYRIENVATKPAERITANDEERRRQGFDIQTTFRWATRDGEVDVRTGEARDGAGAIASLIYGAGATITRLNKGLRRRANQTQLGFRIDPLSGAWEKNEDDDDTPADPTEAPKQWIVPSVEDTKNALLFQLASGEVSEGTVATVQHAIVRGLETVFELEQGEILAEPMPNREHRTGFLFYEATEGGAGVLSRLVTEPDKLSEVAAEALRIIHFRIDETHPLPATIGGLVDEPGTACVAACYKCLMSYFNQPDHEKLDRRDESARQILLRLARATTLTVERRAPEISTTRRTAGNDVLSALRAHLVAAGLPDADAEMLTLDDGAALAWRSHYAAAVIEDVPTASVAKLEDRGFEVIRFSGDKTSWTPATDQLAKLLRR